MNWTQIIGLAAGVCTATSLLPQIIKTIKEKKAEDVSIGMLIVLLCGVSIWIAYGILRNDLPIIATNCVSFLFDIITLWLKLRYNNKSSAREKSH